MSPMAVITALRPACHCCLHTSSVRFHRDRPGMEAGLKVTFLMILIEDSFQTRQQSFLTLELVGRLLLATLLAKFFFKCHCAASPGALFTSRP